MTLRALFTSDTQRALLAVCLAGSAVSLTIAPAIAQNAAAATLSGIVKSADGKPLGDARISIVGPGFSQVVHTDALGRFTVTLPPNTYSVTASAIGFEDERTDGVTVTSTQGAKLTLSLASASLETIGRTTSNRQTAVNPTSSDVTVVSGQTFSDQGSTQVTNVLDQIPGVEINRPGDASSNAPGGNTSISIRGAQPYESQILIDGHPVTTAGNGAFGFNSTFINALLLGDVEVGQGPGNFPLTIEDAVGGTLNFKTPAITTGPTATAIVGYDSFNGQYYGLRASDTFGKVGFEVGIARFQTPGYLPPNFVTYGDAYDSTVPGVSAGTANQARVGVVNFNYPATQSFESDSQLAKLAYNFSSNTSIQLTSYTTQSVNDETGTNLTTTNVLVVPCINYKATTIATATDCTPGGKGQNYTSTPNLGLVGSTVALGHYPYPDTYELDNEPIYSAEFHTVIGPGSFLARYYAGTIDRTVSQDYGPQAVNPCSSPACPSGDNFSTNPPTFASNSYDGEPYIEPTIDKLHGVDAQYAIPFGSDSVTLGFDRHSDDAIFGSFDPTQETLAQALEFGEVTSIAYSLRGVFALTPKLTLESGNYLSNTSYVGTRFDPRDGLVYHVDSNASVRASAGSAYVAPYYDLINPSSYVSDGTLNLATGAFKPETSFGYDVGSDIKLNRDSLLSLDGYLTNVFNRYASVTEQVAGSFEGTPFTAITQEGNQANVREEGVEANFLYAPRVGVGFHTAIDLLRDYAYNQNSAVKTNDIFDNQTPGNNVQLPGYPYSKFRNDLFYTFKSGLQARFGATSYGANNSYGQPGFTLFDAQLRLPVHGFTVNIGGENIFNYDNYQAGAIYDGGYTFQTAKNTPGFTTLFYTQPRTLFIQLEKAVGPNGNVELPRASL